MQNDAEELQKLNIEINEAENRGDRDYLESALAPELAFLRASGIVVDRRSFLQNVAPKEFHGKFSLDTQPNAIEVFGDRAIVKGIVLQGGKNYHNIRLFIRISGSWKLLGWANEEIR